jgi:two-component system, LytTR family, sensor kinase
LRNKNSNDTNWKAINKLSSLHLDLQANNNYELLFRYKFQPETTNVYSFHVKPFWWQSWWFKVLAIIFSLSLLFFLIFYFYQNRKKQQLLKQQEETEKRILELKAIRSQLNPHFIFNSLSSIQGLINSNKIDDANYYLAEFSNLMRNTLIESDKLYQTLQKEIELLETYLKLEQLRFQFEYEIKTDENIKTNEIEIPSLLLQPLVENAVKHGVSELREKGKVSILFFTTANNLIAEIKDNGSGFNNKNNAEGFGLKLTYDRIVLLNKMNKDQIIDKKIFRINNETVIQIIFKNII